MTKYEAHFHSLDGLSKVTFIKEPVLTYFRPLLEEGVRKEGWNMELAYYPLGTRRYALRHKEFVKKGLVLLDYQELPEGRA